MTRRSALTVVRQWSSAGAMAAAAATVVGLVAIASSPSPGSDRLSSFARRLEMERSSDVGALAFRNVGPVEMGGRIADIAVPDPSRPSTFLVAYATGGVWRTTDGGKTFQSLFDGQATSVIGTIAVDPGDADVIWVGTGEAHASRSTYAGTGIYKSTDGGHTWRHMGLAETHRIGRISIDPTNPDVVLVAAQGPLWSHSPDRGIYRTVDGGNTWHKTLYVDDTTSGVDVRRHPASPNTVYATMWTKDRTEWSLRKAGAGSGVWRSTDGGVTWTRLAGGLPSGEQVGRIGLAVTPASPDLVCAVVDNQTLEPPAPDVDQKTTPPVPQQIVGAQLYCSSDRGDKWQQRNRSPLHELFFTYGHYFADVLVSPRDPATIYLLGVPLLASSDGGATWRELGENVLHADHHALWADPLRPGHLLSGNDGGLNESWDGGARWNHLAVVPAAQFYAVAVDMARPYNIYGGLQDSGIWFGPSDKPALSNHWTRLGDGDGMYVQVDPRDPTRIVYGAQFADYKAIDGRSRKPRDLAPKAPAGSDPDRFGFESPILMSPHDVSTIYMASQRLYRSRDFGRSFAVISQDLTAHVQFTNMELPYSTISTIDESPRRAGMIYVGTDDGKAWVTRDHGVTWTDISAGLVAGRYVSRVTASTHVDGRVYLTQTAVRWDEWKAYLFRSEDYGRHWTSAKGDLPDEPVNVIREDPTDGRILYLGTDLGAWVSLDGGVSWHPLTGGLPHVPVRDLLVHPRDGELVIGTHGRSIYVGDVKPLRRQAGKTP